MTVAVMPDAVEMAVTFLNGRTDVTTVVGNRIASSSPKDTSKPWVRINRIGGPRSPSAPMRLARADLQVDAFAPPAPSTQTYKGDVGAMQLALLVEAHLLDAAGFATDDGVIAYVLQTQGSRSQPDTSRTPPTPRAFFVVSLTVRPA